MHLYKFVIQIKKKKNEEIIEYKNFKIVTEKEIIKNQILIDYKIENGKKKIIIKAPTIKKEKKINLLINNIKKTIENQINPKLESHGGFVEIVDILNNYILILKFNGGCQGCSMVNSTLTQGIASIIKKEHPSIKEIHDITNHSVNKNAYFK